MENEQQETQGPSTAQTAANDAKDAVQGGTKLAAGVGRIAAGDEDPTAWLEAAGGAVQVAKPAAKVWASCCLVELVFAVFVGLFIINLFAPANEADKAAANIVTNAKKAIVCVANKSSIPTIPKADCNGGGYRSTKKSSNGYYNRTSFGCSGKYTDSGDACDSGGCGGASMDSILKTSGEKSLKGLKGAAYQRAVEYFSANREQYGCDARLKVTNPKTGQAVVVVPIDAGPNCRVQGGRYTFDMSNVASEAIGTPSKVKVEVVDKKTPVGPITTCATADTGAQYIACALNSALDTSVLQNIVNKSVN